MWSTFMDMAGLNMVKYGLFGLIRVIIGEWMNGFPPNFYQ